MRASAVVGLCCSLLGCAAANATGFDVDSLVALLAERQVRKVEDALPLLPAEVRANYVLVYASRSLLGRAVTAADVAESVAFLLSERSRATTGCVLTVDGGVAAAFPR